MTRAVLFFCIDREIDPVAPDVFEMLGASADAHPDAGLPGGWESVELRTSHGQLSCVGTTHVLSRVLDRHSDVVRRLCKAADWAGIVNWHEGRNGPEKLLTVHSYGDVPSGRFCPVDPGLTSTLLSKLRSSGARHALDDYVICQEATHFSGTEFGLTPESLDAIEVPFVDIEIGSVASSWTDPRPKRALAEALLEALDVRPSALSLLFFGGVHFEPSFTKPALEGAAPIIGLAHHLPNQWVVGHYKKENGGVAKLRRACDSVIGGVDVLVFHDKLKGEYKDVARQVAAQLDVPAVSHKKIRPGSSFLADQLRIEPNGVASDDPLDAASPSRERSLRPTC